MMNFDEAIEYICDNCSCACGVCEIDDDKKCPFWSDFDDLEKLYDKFDAAVDELADRASKGIDRGGMWSDRELFNSRPVPCY